MAGRGATDSFGDGLYRIVQEIARVKLAPDADHDFLSQLENLLLARYKQSTPTGAPSAGGAGLGLGAASGETGAPPIPVSPEVAPGMGGLSRGPTPRPDLSGAVSELERVMSAS